MTVIASSAPPVIPGVSDRPAGERYYRHPGDVVHLIAWLVFGACWVLLLALADDTSSGVRTDLGRIFTAPPDAARELLLVAVQAAAVLAPASLVALLVVQGRWRRLATVVAAATVGAVLQVVLRWIAGGAVVPGSLTDESWLISTRFPSVVYLAAVTSVATVRRPWISHEWRRADIAGIGVVALAMAMAGTAGVPELAVAVAAGGVGGSIVLVACGAPNRRATTAHIVAALGRLQVGVTSVEPVRVADGRSQLVRARSSGGTIFVKVYGRESRDADVLYRAYRSIVLREPGLGWPAPSLERAVDHECLMLLLARQAGINCPAVRAIAGSADGSIILAMDDVGGRRLDELSPEEIGCGLLDGVWSQVTALHAAGLSHGSLRAANVLVPERGAPVLIDMGVGSTSASGRAQAIDRAELLSSLASLVGPDAAVASAARVVAADDLAAVLPYLQPLALSAATRRAAPKSLLAELRTRLAVVAARQPPPLEPLVRVRPRTLITIATLTGAFYVLLPQLANVDDSIAALGSAHWAWLVGAVAASAMTYVASAIGMLGSTSRRLPLLPTTEVSLASSFVNRVTPANIGGMALNVRYLQKAGVPPTEAVTGVGLNVVAGGIVHIGFLALFFTWAGRNDATSFSVPGGATLLGVIAGVLALAGVVLAATRVGRGVARRRLLPALLRSLTSIADLSRSPKRLAALFGGSAGVTLAYITAMACVVAAFDGGLAFAQVGAVYLGASLIAAAAPTPGGLGALEAALVAGFTTVGVPPGIAVAAVLSYRLITYWLPVLPGWLCFRRLDRRGFV